MKSYLFPFSFVISMLCAPLAYSADFFISPEGNNAHLGTIDQPFATIQKAATIMKAGDRCLIREGIYRETVTPRHTGTPEAPLIFEAYQNERVVISGLDTLELPPDTDEKPVALSLTTDLKIHNQVFFDGRPGWEARWPNAAGNDFMNPYAHPIGENATTSALTGRFPESFSAESLEGASVWCLAGSKWSAWTAPITGFSEGRLHINPDTKGPWVTKNHNPAHGGIFYVHGAKSLLDAPGEWFVDSAAKQVLAIPPKGTKVIETKARLWGFNLDRKQHIQISNIELFGCSITLNQAEHCILDGLRVNYPSWEMPERQNIFFSSKTGIYMSGSGNRLLNSTIAYSVGNGVEVKGTGNIVANNFIHDCNAMSIYASPIRAYGDRMLITHNTLKRCSRDGLYCKGATRSRLEYNDISEYGMNCHDLGGIYGGGHDFENSVFAYNHVHSATGHIFNGIYFDNFAQNYIVHHNVIWDINGTCIRLNTPAHYGLVYNNTCLGAPAQHDINNAYGPWKGNKRTHGSMVYSNLVYRGVTLRQESNGVDTGGILFDNIVYPLETPHATSAAETRRAGAHQHGTWQAGQRETFSLDSIKTAPLPAYRNQLKNASFNNYRREECFKIWHPAGDGQVELIRNHGFNFPGPESRNAIHGQSIALNGKDCGIKQAVQLERADTYRAACYVRNDGNAQVGLIIRDHQGKKLASCRFTPVPQEDPWHILQADFSLQNDGLISFEVIKRGDSQVFVDDTGLALLWEGEPDDDNFNYRTAREL
ncbi:hypothetical protein PDESU_05486 [Pontiella desulfatans]|uniref:Right handed beta helix domain-containing protein n=1 Tax=Pontiella desulfatans TaxID=2750659 RepID=A0A6C2UC10_PONDE|nr:right-handed parallel beta-helix repeat-containing protein [Pontiella desulfatans]VGO16894.1 hypothetical protein PDESU_05486 [Pontiella desulfatans]